MNIRVLYADGAVASVPAAVLNPLIQKDQILAFERSSGWVCVWEDPIRKELQPYQGNGKRGYDIYLK